MIKIIRFFAFTICLATASFAHAAPLINGVAIHSELGQESFIGALYTTTFASQARDILIAQEEKQIQVRVLAKRISSRRFKRMWIEGLAINASAGELETQSRNMAKFSNMLKVTLVKGDIFSVQRTATSVKVAINGAPLGEIEDIGFFDLLLRTWIGPVPLSSEFRSNLLQSGNIDETLLAQFYETVPSDERIVAVAAALAESKKAKRKPAKRAPVVAAVAIAAPPTLHTPPKITAPIIGIAPQPPSATTSTGDEQTVAASQEVPDDANSAATEVASLTGSDTELQGAPESTEPESILDEDFEEFTAESLLEQQLYIAKLKKWTNKKLRYPTRSLQRDEQGTVRLNVIINREGNLVEVSVIEEAEFKRLTKAALKAVDKSQPYPAMPENLTGNSFEFSLPIVFKLVNN